MHRASGNLWRIDSRVHIFYPEDSMEIPDWIESNKKELVFGFIGIGFMSYGLWQSYSEKIQQDSLVVIQENSSQKRSSEKILVDVSGAVENPGIYTFSLEDRINDALVAAGGLSAEADRGYVSRYMNLAEKLSDGMKVFVPIKDDPYLASKTGVEYVMGEEREDTTNLTSSKLNVNTASLEELDSLWGIGKARAESIISHRPYASLEELVIKAAIPGSVVDRNKSLLQF